MCPSLLKEILRKRSSRNQNRHIISFFDDFLDIGLFDDFCKGRVDAFIIEFSIQGKGKTILINSFYGDQIAEGIVFKFDLSYSLDDDRVINRCCELVVNPSKDGSCAAGSSQRL